MASTFGDKNKFGGVGHDQSDEDEQMTGFFEFEDKSPMTRQAMKRTLQKAELKLLGPMGTYLTLMKGFICTGVLFLPNAVLSGGYGFSAIMIFAGAALTYISAMKLLKVKASMKAGSYTEIGQKLYGPLGKAGVQITVGCSQVGFRVGMIYFMIENIS